MEDRYVVALDPGYTTGYAVGNVLGAAEADASSRPVLDVVYAGAIGTHARVLDTLDSMPELTCVVCEVYTTANIRSKSQVKTLELIGAIRGFCYLNDIEFIRQYPTQRRPFLRQAKSTIGKRAMPSDARPHAIDALAHLMRAASTKGYNVTCAKLRQ